MKRIKLKRVKNFRAIIDVTPMIDLIVLIMIFFLVTSSFGRLSTVNVNLPKAQQSADKQSGDVVISIDASNAVFLNDEKIDVDQLPEKIKSLPKASRVIIRGDKKSDYDSIIRIIDILNRAGLKNFVLATVKSQ